MIMISSIEYIRILYTYNREGGQEQTLISIVIILSNRVTISLSDLVLQCHYSWGYDNGWQLSFGCIIGYKEYLERHWV